MGILRKGGCASDGGKTPEMGDGGNIRKMRREAGKRRREGEKNRKKNIKAARKRGESKGKVTIQRINDGSFKW